MFIAIRKEPNGALYMDKDIYSRMETLKFSLQGFEEFKKENSELEYTYEQSQETIEKQVVVYNQETPEIKPEIITKEEVVDIVLVTKRVFTDEQLSQPPYNYTKVEIDDKYSDCQASDFNDDLTFSIEKYNARKQKENETNYETLIVSKIRQKYSVNQELAILRQQTTKPEEYQEYFNYVEQCKAEAKSEVLNDNNTIN